MNATRAETAARIRKVQRLAAAAYRLGYGPADLTSPAVRDAVTREAKVQQPSDQTWMWLLNYLRDAK